MGNREVVRQVGLIAERELTTRLRGRPFLISTLLIVAVMIGYALVPGVGVSTSAGVSKETTVGISRQSRAITKQVQQVVDQRGENISVRSLGTVVDPDARLRDTGLNAVVSGRQDKLRLTFRDAVDSRLRQVIDGVARSRSLTAQLKAAGIDPTDVQRQLAVAHPRVRVIDSGASQHRQQLFLGIIMVIVLYLSLTLYGSQVAVGVVEEKSSRVVEVLLATIRPWQLLFGKVMGIGAVGFIQLAIVGITALIVGETSGAFALPATSVTSVFFGLVWFVLGFLLYATIYAGAGALVSRQQDAQTVVAPISMLIVIAFLLGGNLLATQANAPTTVVLSILPPFAPVLMPGRIALGGVNTLQLVLAVVATIIGIGTLTWFAGRIYARAVLRTGGRVRLRDALR